MGIGEIVCSRDFSYRMFHIVIAHEIQTRLIFSESSGLKRCKNTYVKIHMCFGSGGTSKLSHKQKTL